MSLLLLFHGAAGPPPPVVVPVAAIPEKITLGTKESLAVTPTPTLGGRFGW